MSATADTGAAGPCPQQQQLCCPLSCTIACWSVQLAVSKINESEAAIVEHCQVAPTREYSPCGSWKTGKLPCHGLNAIPACLPCPRKMRAKEFPSSAQVPGRGGQQGGNRLVVPLIVAFVSTSLVAHAAAANCAEH